MASLAQPSVIPHSYTFRVRTIDKRRWRRSKRVFTSFAAASFHADQAAELLAIRSQKRVQLQVLGVVEY